ncbi:hypothetical protein I3842_11G190700 [Carya illinoinensis]|uniref:Uncharacterized protein n=1 Tax=Carya illinoinensis TaxID=32201 RepID=A0A922J2A3_CARIL|nr:hypothetical protein I3842_11G190700 [Carya illinoinensis]
MVNETTQSLFCPSDKIPVFFFPASHATSSAPPPLLCAQHHPRLSPLVPLSSSLPLSPSVPLAYYVSFCCPSSTLFSLRFLDVRPQLHADKTLRASLPHSASFSLSLPPSSLSKTLSGRSPLGYSQQRLPHCRSLLNPIQPCPRQRRTPHTLRHSRPSSTVPSVVCCRTPPQGSKVLENPDLIL